MAKIQFWLQFATIRRKFYYCEGVSHFLFKRSSNCRARTRCNRGVSSTYLHSDFLRILFRCKTYLLPAKMRQAWENFFHKKDFEHFFSTAIAIGSEVMAWLKILRLSKNSIYMNTRKRLDSPSILFSQGTTYSKKLESKYDKFEHLLMGREENWQSKFCIINLFLLS